MPDSATLPFGKDRKPDWPIVHARKGLTRGQKARLCLSQDGKCAGCGIKPRRFEFDHRDPLWTGANPSSLADWQALGGREDCECHKAKTSAEATERARMNRIRKKALKETRKPAVMKSRNTLSTRSSPSPGKWGGGKYRWPSRKMGKVSRSTRDVETAVRDDACGLTQGDVK